MEKQQNMAPNTKLPLKENISINDPFCFQFIINIYFILINIIFLLQLYDQLIFGGQGVQIFSKTVQIFHKAAFRIGKQFPTTANNYVPSH